MALQRLREEDLPDIVALYRSVFEEHRSVPDSALQEYFRRIYLGVPSFDPEISSLLYTSKGSVVGFIGVTPRPLVFRGRAVRSAIGSNFMVNPEARRSAAGIVLLKGFLEGKQDLSVAEGTPVTRALWQRLGGTVVPVQSLHWMCPLRRLSYFASRAIRSRGLFRMARPVLSMLDAVLPSPLVQSVPSTLQGRDLDPAEYIRCLEEVGSRYALKPSADPVLARGMLDHLKRKKALGQLRGRTWRTPGGEAAGWYLWAGRSGATARLLQIGATNEHWSEVFQHLVAHALREGCTGLGGRLEPQLVDPVRRQTCFFSHRDNSMLVSTRDEALLRELWEGNALFTPLEGESWLLYEEME